MRRERFTVFAQGRVALTTYVVLFLVGLVTGWAAGTLTAPDLSVAPTVTVTVTQTSQMMNDGAAAVGDVDGQPVLLRGNWAEGMQVQAYPVQDLPGTDVPGVYSTVHPQSGYATGWAWFGASIGLLAAAILLLVGIWADYTVDRARARSLKTVDAALSRVQLP